MYSLEIDRKMALLPNSYYHRLRTTCDETITGFNKTLYRTNQTRYHFLGSSRSMVQLNNSIKISKLFEVKKIVVQL